MKPLRYPETTATVEQLRPLGDLVLVRPLPEAEKIGQIFLPDNARNPERGLRRGVVVACGPGDMRHDFELKALDVPPELSKPCTDFSWWPRHAMHVKPGDIVIYPRVPANGVTIDGAEHFLIHEEQHVLAVIE